MPIYPMVPLDGAISMLDSIKQTMESYKGHIDSLEQELDAQRKRVSALEAQLGAFQAAPTNPIVKTPEPQESAITKQDPLVRNREPAPPTTEKTMTRP